MTDEILFIVSIIQILTTKKTNQLDKIHTHKCYFSKRLNWNNSQLAKYIITHQKLIIPNDHKQIYET